jgi:hypothetical protein
MENKEPRHEWPLWVRVGLTRLGASYVEGPLHPVAVGLGVLLVLAGVPFVEEVFFFAVMPCLILWLFAGIIWYARARQWVDQHAGQG